MAQCKSLQNSKAAGSNPASPLEVNMEQYKGKTVVFCLPGNNYSGRFLTSFTELIMVCRDHGIRTLISQSYSSMVNFARCKVAGADVQRGKRQEPFGGKVPYDYMMWIDSDIAFQVENFYQLLRMDKDIASGWYCQPNSPTVYTPNFEFYTPVVEHMNNDFFEQHGTFRFLKNNEISQKKEPFKADYIGFGWVLIKKGVFEKLHYPWFAPKPMNIGSMQDMCSEDVSFCMDARKAKFDIWVNPETYVGHEKTLII